MLSKSQFAKGLHCPKLLWLSKHPEVFHVEPQAASNKIEAGNDVGRLAQQLFPNGHLVEFDVDNFQSMIDKTQSLMEDGVEVIYEATFKNDKSFVMVDLLVKEGDSWSIYEVKSSTSVKESHLYDVAFQWTALKNHFSLKNCFVVHVNKQYVFEDVLDVVQLFNIEDVTEQVQILQPEIQKQRENFDSIIASDKAPNVMLGKHCLKPNVCEYKAFCWHHIPETSIFNLYKLSEKNKRKLYEQGVIDIVDIPSDFKLTPAQQLQVNTLKTGRTFVDHDIINSFVSDLAYPLHFFDFETFNDAVPRFNGLSPYKMVPFQYSLHILYEDGKLVHKEFLGEETSDPREDLINCMLNDFETSGSIIVFYQTFEINRIKELAADFPKYSDDLLSLLPRFTDLLIPFRDLGYYHPKFNGSFSIKSILPALYPDLPELDYKNLSVQDGGDAMSSYASLRRIESDDVKNELRQQLKAYCRLDTYAMVKILEKLTPLRFI